ncbi:unnamed protein product [Sphenostylis stenocarpa]|uniref:Uncharacterized protein n=1 Tax=Sphenostylis stenocarpa TaxID=92480 RepID=A0AA86W5D1_9FABA|nr:unnamed protein product [Sphenostylis stenocarpa]
MEGIYMRYHMALSSVPLSSIKLNGRLHAINTFSSYYVGVQLECILRVMNYEARDSELS